MHRKPFTRGTSVLAALVFVAILGVVAYGVGAISPQQSSLGQTAANASVVSPAQLASQKALIASINDIKAQNAKKCLDAKNSARSNAGTSRSEPQSFNKGKDTVESGNCIGAVYEKGDVNNANSYKCVGLKTKIYMDKTSTGQIISHPDASVEEGKCSTTFCDASGVNCGASKLVSGADGIQKWAANNPDLIKDLPAETQKAIIGISPLDAQTQDAFRNAFSEQAKEASQEIDANKKAADSLQQYIDSCGETDAANCGADLTKAQEQKAELEKKNTELSEKVKVLTETQTKDLSPDSSSKDWCSYGGKGTTDCAGGPEGPDPKTCPSGQIYYAGACKAQGSTIPVPQPRPASAPGPEAPQAPSNSGGGIGQALQSILGGLAKALGGAGSGSSTGAACASDPTAYAQQQQQYNTALQQYNLQLQQYNYQQQMNQLNGLPAPVAPVAPSQCTQTPTSNTCATPPAQPSAAGCANGTWKPITTQQSNGASCTTSWQCVPGGSTPAVTPVAELSCQPQVADVGMSIAITFGCTNATESVGSGFDTASSTSGSTTTVIAAPPAGATSINYGIQCRNQGLVGNASCSVQIAKPSIVLLANPKIVPVNDVSTIGWVTGSMQSCVVSSPDMPEFTSRNASSTVVNGMATTSPITADVQVLLHCVTLGGDTRDATTTVQVATSTTS